ncbi:hypothetical protein DC498_22280 [Terrimonas sp.]|uniref:hypothetical protein n=1 Tax=Terrimonas sp. TaxID=1914338 RepID=UPI000927B197|nr:hypothetical protein [Terrimonas sp.]OJY98132.1 MAG: hypothetical protein BGP13_10800 [Sphingobacteriales bacterium 40-81]PVD49742.1 hypothetical protein DC498_23625 [Terrimonas sp.]PVD49944.1 hypothetical protein DC498_22280 [Terrimonas sp.]
MAKIFDADATLQRLRNRYRMVIMNDDTYEEVVTLRLSRLSVYITLCTIFVLLVGLTVALLVFTPLRYYVPGYGSGSERRELITLKMQVDSLQQEMKYRDKYFENIQNVLKGNTTAIITDTTLLTIPKEDKTED